MRGWFSRATGAAMVFFTSAIMLFAAGFCVGKLRPPAAIGKVAIDAGGGSPGDQARPQDSGPDSDAEAARFLAQATFGPTLADIRHLRQIGYVAWLDEQVALPATHELEYLDWVGRALGEKIDPRIRMEAWFLGALGGPDPANPTRIHADQLRQRVAFALSEIFVVSDHADAVADTPKGAARYYDILVDDAFGNYRTLLEHVTLSPAMGVYLSMLGNRKPDTELNIRPDENYAREIMQLFSIGLVRLNLDGTPMLSGGQPTPTYDQNVVKGFAHAFTGWKWAGCTAENWDDCAPDGGDGSGAAWLHPMTAVEEYHDTGAQDSRHHGKQLLDYPGVALAKGLLPPGGSARADLQAALDNVFNHPNVGPFIGGQLIQRLVTSNPSPAYVRRVAAVFNDNGRGVRGDLKAVVKAILFDPEARNSPAALPDHFGKLREPLLRLTHLWRAMDARHHCGRNTRGEGHYKNPYRYPEWDPQDVYGQGALRSPSVFNFFKPRYAPPGEASQRALVAPEFQITTDSLITSDINDIFERTDQDLHAACDPQETAVGHVAIDLARDSGGPSSLASDPARLLDQYDLLFLSGQMSPLMRRTLLDYLSGLTADTWGEDYLRARVQTALFLILSSPEYAVQK